MCPRPAVPKNSPLAVYPQLPGVTDRESSSWLSLSQSITTSKICKSSVLMTVQQYGGWVVGGPPPLELHSFSSDVFTSLLHYFL